MNSNNWLSFPLSPSHPAHMSSQTSQDQGHHFSLGLINDNLDNSFQTQGMCGSFHVYIALLSKAPYVNFNLF